MTAILIPLVVILAFGAWLTAAYSAISLVSLAPKGEKFSTYMALGWWRFDTVRARIGPAAEPHLKRYRLAFMAFFALILGVIVVAAAAMMAMAPGPATGSLS